MQTIVYLVPSLTNSGPINVVYGIVKHLDRARFRPVIVALSEPRLVARRNQAAFEALGIEVRNYHYGKLYCELHVRRIARRLGREFPEMSTVFHAHGYYPTLILSHMTGRHTMTTMHNICGEDFRMSKGRLLGSYMTWQYRKALRRLQLCVPISDGMQRYYGRDARVRQQVVYNGVEVPPAAPPQADARKRLGLQDGSFVLFYPAGFTVGKNHQYLIEEVLNRPDLPVQVVFAGAGETEAQCRRQAAHDPRFRFLGFQMDLGPWWQVADALVSPSLSEGFPMAVLEAVVRGLPCLLSSIPPHLEIARRVFGSDRWCFNVHEAGSLGRLLAEAVRERFDRRAIAARAVRHYSSEVMSRAYEQLYARAQAGSLS